MTNVLTIDGSFGEGGGQILRSSLALAMVTGTPFVIRNIRARRKRPGLMRQHLTAVQAATEVCGGRVHGDAVGSTELRFGPGPVRGGEYHFAIGTAGSTTLVLQTVLLPLVLADSPSRVILEGGTHNPFAPPFEFLDKTYLPLLNRMGPQVRATLERPGFYPAGGGRIVVEIAPAGVLGGTNSGGGTGSGSGTGSGGSGTGSGTGTGNELRGIEPLSLPGGEGRVRGQEPLSPAGGEGRVRGQEPLSPDGGEGRVRGLPHARLRGFDLLERGELTARRAHAVVARLPRHIAQREVATIQAELSWPDECCDVVELNQSAGPGNVVWLELEYEHVTEVMTAFGKVGRPAEAVARDAAEQARRYLASTAPVGEHLTDQLILPLAIAGRGAFLSTGLTLHAQTHLELIRAVSPLPLGEGRGGEGIRDVRIDAQPQPDGTALIRIG